MIKIENLQALYGGTFDPVHYGHLKSVEALSNLIGLQQIIIIPNNIPPHRIKPEANSIHRKKMLELAISNKSLFSLDERELRKNRLSYTSQTLQEWRKEHGLKKPIAFIIGQDSLLIFPSWYQYEIILKNSHLIVCRRPGYFKKKKIPYQTWLRKYVTSNIEDLYNLPSGKIFLAKTPKFDISANLIRQRLKDGLSCKDMLPPRVLEYILRYRLYSKIK